MDYRDKILALAKLGPLLPSGVAKALETNSIMAGAMMSEMVSKGMLRTSALRVGGSPLYLIPGNESQLLSFTGSLNEKDRRTVSLLEQQKIIRASEADPLTRVSLSNIKDFAVPLSVEYAGNHEVFWKWFALSDSEASELIGIKLVPPSQVPIEKKEADVEKKEVEQVPVQKDFLPRKEEVAVEKKVESKQDTLVKENSQSSDSNFPSSNSGIQPASNVQRPTVKKELKADGDFWEKVNKFLAENKITLIQHSVVKKKTEFDLLVELPSPVGSLQYYCKARSKKKVAEGDISSAYVQGQLKKLPVIFLTDGELSKQAKDVLSQLKGITVKQM